MKSQNTIPANSESICHCCGRNHRKLHLVNGYWLGGTCAESYKLYQIDSRITSLYWRGYEKKHAQVAKMVGQTK